MSQRKFSKYSISLSIIVAIGAFLRFFRISENIYFEGELGHNYLAIKNLLTSKTIPLIGPPTSHEWLSFGPLYYWLFGPVLALGGYHPIIGSIFFGAIGVGVILLNYAVVKRFFNARIALISSFFVAFSPIWLLLARQARFFSLVVPLFYLYFLFLIKTLKNKDSIFWLGLVLGLMFNFHFSPLILLVPTTLLLFIHRSKFRLPDYLKGIGGMFLPQLPFLMHDSQSGFEMTRSLLLWIPYRVLGFIGLYPKNNLTATVLNENVQSFGDFLTQSYFGTQSMFLSVIAIVPTVFIAWFLVRNRKVRNDISYSSLVLIFIVGYIAIFIHGSPPYHYFLPLFPIPLIFVGIFFDWLWKQQKSIAGILLALIFMLNSLYIFSGNWMYIPLDKRTEENVVPYELQEAIVNYVVSDSFGADFELHRIGSYDQFEGDFAQNYQYLMWLAGNEPVVDAELSYTIYEDVDDVGKEDIVWIGNLAVKKSIR